MWYLSLLVFLDKALKYEPYICTGCHYLIQKAMRFNDMATVSVNGSDYTIHFFVTWAKMMQK